jgi:hypothetical protein
MPTGTPFRIDGQSCAFIGPVAELSAWTGAISDVEFWRRPIGFDPPMPAERQRRTLDPPSYQPLIEIAVKAPQPIEVDSVLMNRYELRDRLFPSRTQRQKHGLIRE